MILLDTNVVSEAMKPRLDDTVIRWLNQQTIETMYFTATGLSELLLGIALLPAGRRRTGLGMALADLMSGLFGPRILAFDAAAAAAYADLVGRARGKGVAVSMADGQIAAIATVHRFCVVTRDRAPFLAAGLTVIDPWVEAA